jgi:cytochrome c peroxidase
LCVLGGMKPFTGILGSAFILSCGTRATVPPTPPLGLDWAMQIPVDNLPTQARIDLGRRLFFDPLLSADQTLSCSSCHRPDYAFADSATVSRGVHARPGKRNAPSLMNVGYMTALAWDGRNATLEEQVLRPFRDSLELALGLPELERRLNTDPAYRQQFRKAFKRNPNAEDIAHALASYVRTLRSGNSDFDRYRNGDGTTIKAVAVKGLRLFNGKAGCSLCHIGPLLSDGRFHNTGNGVRSRDPGRHNVTGVSTDLHAFRTASLRDVALTAPYMHDGGLRTLEEVIEFYDRGGLPNAGLDQDLRPLGLTTDEKHALVVFLRSLTGTAMIARRSP